MDFDADGHDDILSGSWPGELYLFGRNPDGTFRAAAKIEDEQGAPIKVGSAAAVYAADWDSDDDLDLLVGVIEGHVYLVPNVGDRANPAYGEPTRLTADGEEIKVAHGDAGPAVADWDGDGLADLLVGTGAGSVLWYRNAGSSTEPELAAGEVLVEESPNQYGQPGDDNRCGLRTKICVTDYDGDGQLDLLVGDFSMVSEEQKLSDADREAGERAREKLLALSRKVSQLSLAEDEAAEDGDSGEDADTGAESAAGDKAARLRNLLKEYQQAQEEYAKYQPTRHQYHGYVWLLRRESKAGK